MSIYWSLKQIPQLSSRSRLERRTAFRRFRGQTLHGLLNRWSATAWTALIGVLLGSAFASSFLSDVPAACVLGTGGIAAFYLHFLIIVNHMGRSLRTGEFAM